MAEFSLEDIQLWLNRRGRITLAFDAILSILHDNLPQVLTAYDLPAIKLWDYAGVEMQPGQIPAILVSGAVRTENLGTDFGDEAQINIVVAYTVQITRRQLQTAWEIAQIVSAVLSIPGVAGPRKDGDRVLWNWLLPAGYSLVPPTWPHYQGVMSEHRMLQSPENRLWE